MKNDEVLALRKIVPGMIMVCEIDMQAINGDLKERRPYYVVASTNRRVTLLKMTKGGKNSTNWLLPLQMPNGDVSNIVMDCLITVDINKITYRRCVWFTSTDLAVELLNRAIGALIYESSDPHLLRDQKNIDRINNIIDNHEDTNRAYSLYSMQYTLGDEDVDYEGGDTDYEYDEDDEEEEELDEEEEIEEVDDNTEDEDEVVEDTEPEPEEEETNEEDDLKNNKIQLVVKHGNSKWKNPTVDSLFIPGDTSGSLTFDDIRFQLENCGIQENVAKTTLGIMVKYGKIAYNNGRYRARLKWSVAGNKERKKYYANIIEDSNIYGNLATAKLWNISSGYVSQLRKKYGKV
jgi:hypothetical protein